MRMDVKLFPVTLLSFVLSAVAAPEFVSFNSGWEFRREGEKEWKRTDVPHDAAFGLGYDRKEDPDHGFAPCPRVTYRKTFARPSARGRHSIRFDGVYMDSSVSVNGKTVGGSRNGYLPFEVPLDGLVTTNVIEVACDARTPNTRWYAGGGILRDVWLVRRDGFTLEPENVSIATGLNPDGSATVQVDVDGAKVVSPVGGEFNVRNPKLWTPETPILHHVDIVAENASGERDCLRMRYGIRTVEFTPDRGLLLNGKQYRIKGLCRHETFGALGGAFNEAVTRRELAMAKDIGANAIRTAHNPFSPKFYELCDELGFLVMNEAFDEWRLPKTERSYSRFFDDCWRADLERFVRRDRNHPSVVLWSIGNEIYDFYQGDGGAALAKAMVEVVHSMDRTRPVTAGLNHPSVSATNGVMDALDAVGLNYNADWYAKVKGRKPVFGSETAPSLAERGVYLFEERDGMMVPVQARENRECAYSPEAFEWAAPAEVALKVQMDSFWSAGEFAWCTYDYLGEPNRSGCKRKSDYWPARSSYWGLCDMAGLPKDRYWLYRSRWNPAPTVHLMPNWTHPGKEGKVFPVWCYTNAEECELFLNGRSQGVRRFADTDKLHLEWMVAYEPGVLEVSAKMKDGTIVWDRRTTAGKFADFRNTLEFEHGDLAFVRIDAVDADGNVIIACNEAVTVKCAGGEIIALDNGDPTDHTPFSCRTRRLFGGSLVATVRRPPKGSFTIEASAVDANSVVAE